MFHGESAEKTLVKKGSGTGNVEVVAGGTGAGAGAGTGAGAGAGAGVGAGTGAGAGAGFGAGFLNTKNLEKKDAASTSLGVNPDTQSTAARISIGVLFVFFMVDVSGEK